jgi:CheY-like chemotaxis protein
MSHKLLLADDSITIQRVIELTFAEEDVQVLAVGDGKHAIDRIQTDRPDIVLADVGMPERDGYDVAAFVKGNPQLAHIPVLLLTGAFEPIDEGRARAVGCDGVLVKPFEPQMVINRVKDLLAGRKAGASGNGGQAGGSIDAGPGGAAQEPGAEPARPGGDSLEDYFDRLDAAFATLGSDAPAAAQAAPAPAPTQPAVAAAQAATVEDFASWDPDLAGEARRPAAPPPPVPIPVSRATAPIAPAPAVDVAVAAAPAPAFAPTPAVPAPAVSTAPPPSAVRLAEAPSRVSLAEAFSTLLAVEHGQPAGAALVRPVTPAASPDVVEDIVRRVLDRLQDQDVRQTVVEVAERLVREEIDRIKQAGG